MPSIIKLSDDLIAQIAAGEVIERPAYIIKELIDNAIDAKATQISIELSEDIRERMCVADNGIGMDSEDLRLAAGLHTTSKLKPQSDLTGILSLGFRGEALASIQAVAHLMIYSREQSAALGSVYDSLDGSISTAGMPKGTRVVVEAIFEAVPGRKQFVRSSQTERRLIVEIVTAYALAYPTIDFVIKSQEKILFEQSLPTLLERYQSLYSELQDEQCLPIRSEDSYLTITGYLTRPDIRSSSTREQYIIINGRPVKDRLISAAVKEAYGTLLPKDLFPRGVLVLSVPIQLIDINIHPRKEQILFIHGQHVFDAVKAAVSETLLAHNLTFQTANWGLARPITQSVAGALLKSRVLPTVQDSEFFHWETLMQWHSTYMSVETNSGIFLYDQHAVHERILYEEYSAAFATERAHADIFTLESPLPLSLTPADRLLVAQYIDTFEQLGFTLEQRRKGQWVLISVPALFRDRNPVQIIEECLSDLAQDTPVRSIDTISHKLLTYLACRSAVKAGEILSVSRMRMLIEALQKTKQPYTCPHGRPTMIEMKKTDLDVLFKRV